MTKLTLDRTGWMLGAVYLMGVAYLLYRLVVVAHELSRWP
jgi:hypothetical protein